MVIWTRIMCEQKKNNWSIDQIKVLKNENKEKNIRSYRLSINNLINHWLSFFFCFLLITTSIYDLYNNYIYKWFNHLLDHPFYYHICLRKYWPWPQKKISLPHFVDFPFDNNVFCCCYLLQNKKKIQNHRSTIHMVCVTNDNIICTYNNHFIIFISI